jgi:hypothetical protein
MLDSYVTRRLPEPAHSLMGRVRALYLHGSMDWLAAIERIRDKRNIHQNHIVGWNVTLSWIAYKRYQMNIWSVEKKLGRVAIANLMSEVVQKLLDKRASDP